MTRLPRYLILGALASVAVPATTAPAAAQQAQASQAPAARALADRGWVGVSLDVTTTQATDGARSTSVTVVDVSAGSPAARAGIRPGDVIVSINGEQSFPADLRAGDVVRIVLARSGRTRSVDLTAAPRPVETRAPLVWTPFTVRSDSMVDRMYHAMDSLRIRLVRDGDGVALVNVGGLPRGMPTGGTMEPFAPGEVRPPFGFYIFRGEAHDSLRQAMDDLNEQIRGLRARQAARMRELADAARGDASRIDRSDPELRRIDRAMADADRRAADLRDAMERVARREAEAGPDGAVMGRFSTDGSADGAAVAFRPLDPYLLGQNRAAGAAFVELRPELAEYFDVDGGVLVVDVAEHTPADQAGIQPGDVLTDVGGAPIRSMQQLRARLVGAEAEIPLTVVRKGKRLQLLLRP